MKTRISHSQERIFEESKELLPTSEHANPQVQHNYLGVKNKENLLLFWGQWGKLSTPILDIDTKKTH